MDIKLYCWLNRLNQKASWNISNVVFVSAVESQHWLVTEDLLFTVIAFKEGLLPKLNFLLLLDFLPHSQLQLRSEFSCGENEVCYLITLQKKEKERQEDTRLSALRGDMTLNAVPSVANGYTDPQPVSPSTTAPLMWRTHCSGQNWWPSGGRPWKPEERRDDVTAHQTYTPAHSHHHW